MPSSNFICQKCKSKNAGSSIFIDPIPPNTITQLILCGSCNSEIPAHIAYRWKKMTINKAREEWEKYNKEKSWEMS